MKTSEMRTSNGALKQAQKRYLTRKRRNNQKVRESGKLRLSVFRSNEHIYAQIIDDMQGKTLTYANSLEKDIDNKKSGKDVAAAVGARLAERAKAQKLTDIVFARGGFKYHGRVAALADAVRAAGVIK